MDDSRKRQSNRADVFYLNCRMRACCFLLKEEEEEEGPESLRRMEDRWSF